MYLNPLENKYNILECDPFLKTSECVIPKINFFLLHLVGIIVGLLRVCGAEERALPPLPPVSKYGSMEAHPVEAADRVGHSRCFSR